MEWAGEMTSWLAALDDSEDALLRALLLDDDAPLGLAAQDDSTTVEVQTPSLESGHDDTAEAPPVRTKKRKTRSAWRAKDEIERLRRSVVDLESLLAVRSQARSSGTRLAVATNGGGGHTEVSCELWKNVATRQFQRLRESQHENGQLRSRLRQQLAIVKSLNRFVQRACEGLQHHAVPRPIPQIDVTLFAYKRQQLQATVVSLFESLRIGAHYQSHRLEVEEFRKTQTHIGPSAAHVQPGMVLAQSSARRLVPSELGDVSDRLWATAKHSGMLSDTVNPQVLEQSDQSFFVVYSLQFPVPGGTAFYHGMGYRARYRDDHQDINLLAASLWPDASSPSLVQGSGYDTALSVVTKPQAASGALNEVVMNVECSRLVAPSQPKAPLSVPQAALLEAMVVKTHKFLLDQHDRFADGILLGEDDAGSDAVPVTQVVGH